MNTLRHPPRSLTNAGTTAVIAKGGPERRTWILKISAIAATGPITVADANGTYWTAPAAGETFYVPLRQRAPGLDVTVTAPGATQVSVQYAYEGA